MRSLWWLLLLLLEKHWILSLHVFFVLESQSSAAVLPPSPSPAFDNISVFFRCYVDADVKLTQVKVFHEVRRLEKPSTAIVNRNGKRPHRKYTLPLKIITIGEWNIEWRKQRMQFYWEKRKRTLQTRNEMQRKKMRKS